MQCWIQLLHSITKVAKSLWTGRRKKKHFAKSFEIAKLPLFLQVQFKLLFFPRKRGLWVWKRIKGNVFNNVELFPIFYWYIHGLRTPNESFFSNIPNILADWTNRSNKLHIRYHSVFWLVLLAHILSLCIPSSRFCITQTFFLQKAMIFIHFIGFSILDWDMDLGCSEFEI